MTLKLIAKTINYIQYFDITIRTVNILLILA